MVDGNSRNKKKKQIFNLKFLILATFNLKEETLFSKKKEKVTRVKPYLETVPVTCLNIDQ